MQTHAQHTDHEAEDWAHIRKLLADVRSNLEKFESLERSSQSALLRTRASEYSRVNGHAKIAGGGTQDMLVFTLGKDSYAVSCDDIEEVIPLQNLVALPYTNKYILGISSNRGLLFAVIDLKRVLNIPASDLTTMHRVLIVRHESCQVGLLVDAVQGMKSVERATVKDLPREIHERTRHFLRGLAPDNVLIIHAASVVDETTRTDVVGYSQTNTQPGQVTRI